jgi:hypothetical protein
MRTALKRDTDSLLAPYTSAPCCLAFHLCWKTTKGAANIPLRQTIAGVVGTYLKTLDEGP